MCIVQGGFSSLAATRQQYCMSSTSSWLAASLLSLIHVQDRFVHPFKMSFRILRMLSDQQCRSWWRCTIKLNANCHKAQRRRMASLVCHFHQVSEKDSKTAIAVCGGTQMKAQSKWSTSADEKPVTQLLVTDTATSSAIHRKQPKINICQTTQPQSVCDEGFTRLIAH